MRIEVKGGTPKLEGLGLCASCNNGTVMELENGDIEIYCASYALTDQLFKLRRRVLRCSQHERKGAKSIRDYEKAAWVLRTEKGGRKIGFTPYRDLSEDEQKKVDEEIPDEEWDR